MLVALTTSRNDDYYTFKKKNILKTRTIFESWVKRDGNRRIGVTKTSKPDYPII